MTVTVSASTLTERWSELVAPPISRKWQACSLYTSTEIGRKMYFRKLHAFKVLCFFPININTHDSAAMSPNIITYNLIKYQNTNLTTSANILSHFRILRKRKHFYDMRNKNCFLEIIKVGFQDIINTFLKFLLQHYS